MTHWKARTYGSMLFLVLCFGPRNIFCPSLLTWGTVIYFSVRASCWRKTWWEVVQVDNHILEIDSIYVCICIYIYMQVRNVLGYRYQRVQWYVRNCLEEPIAVGLKVSESMKSNRCYALLLWLRHFFWLLSLSKKWSSTPEYGISRWAIAIPPCIFQCKSCCISQ